jgi:hypothetical protein
MKISKLFCFILLIFFVPRIAAQINTMAGYVYSYSDVPVLNGIIDSFNAKTPNLVSSMRRVSSMHGMELGIRYRFSHFSLEFSWSNSFAKVNNRYNAGFTEVKNTLSFVSNTYSLGGEIYFGKIGVGGSFDINRYSLKTAKPLSNPKDFAQSSTTIANRIYINFEVPINDGMSLAFRPFIKLPTAFDFYETAGYLNAESAVNKDQFQSRIVTYGIRILFFNGRRNDDSDN